MRWLACYFLQSCSITFNIRIIFLTSILFSLFNHYHFYCSYKPERYYWEAVITARKVSVVALTVFGKEIGVQRQSQIALLILLACIVLKS